MVLDKRFHEAVKQRGFVVLTGRDDKPRVEKKLGGPVRMNQADQFIAALPGAPRALLRR